MAVIECSLEGFDFWSRGFDDHDWSCGAFRECDQGLSISAIDLYERSQSSMLSSSPSPKSRNLVFAVSRWTTETI